MKTYKGSWSVALLIHNLSSSWRWVVSLTLPLRYASGMTRQCSQSVRLGGPQGWSGNFWGEENLLPLPGFKPWLVQSLAWSLYWRYAGSHLHQVVHSRAVVPVCCLHTSAPQLFNCILGKCKSWVSSYTKIWGGGLSFKCIPLLHASTL
jgi:hypothetical protein